TKEKRASKPRDAAALRNRAGFIQGLERERTRHAGSTPESNMIADTTTIPSRAYSVENYAEMHAESPDPRDGYHK
ncbi:MAG: hypothetical protein KDN05_05200, partial [Verrucomicrobiae bacterium]|nr:hypothetical protein [Verrucomicrobiae bacterium]